MTKQCGKFDTSFNLEVIRMIKKQGLSVQHVNQSMNIDIGQSIIRRWRSMNPSKAGNVASAIRSRTNNNASASLNKKTVN